jgi:TRAP-type C4-dicarboxylate transport system permease small subunit
MSDEKITSKRVDTAHVRPPRDVLSTVINISGIVGSMFFLCVAFIICYEIVCRLIFRSPTMWVNELATWLTIAGSFLLFGYTLKEKGHTRVDFITANLRKSSEHILELFTSSLGIIFLLVLTGYGFQMLRTSYMMQEISQVLQFPLWIVQIFVPLGGFLMLLQALKFLKENLQAVFRGELFSLPGGVKPRSFIAVIAFAASIALGIALLSWSPILGLVVLFFALLFNGMPVAFAMSLFGVIGLFMVIGKQSVMQIPMIAYNSCDSLLVLAFPLFLLSGTVLNTGKIGPRLFNFAYVLVRHLPGGIGIAAIIFCGLFAAMTGSSVAVAAAVSVIALPEMLKRGYSKNISIGLLAAGGTLGVLFPPSLALIM